MMDARNDNRHFVMTGKFPKATAQVYNDLFTRRQESDYVDFVQFEASQVRPWIVDAERFVEYIAARIEGHS
jgi:uncharacterized protein (UPF0332 family)